MPNSWVWTFRNSSEQEWIRIKLIWMQLTLTQLIWMQLTQIQVQSTPQPPIPHPSPLTSPSPQRPFPPTSKAASGPKFANSTGDSTNTWPSGTNPLTCRSSGATTGSASWCGKLLTICLITQLSMWNGDLSAGKCICRPRTIPKWWFIGRWMGPFPGIILLAPSLSLSGPQDGAAATTLHSFPTAPSTTSVTSPTTLSSMKRKTLRTSPP